MKRRYEGGETNGGPHRRGSSTRPSRGSFQGSRLEGRVHFNGGRADDSRGPRSSSSKGSGSLAAAAPPRERGPRPLTDDPFLFVEVPVNATIAGGFIGVKGDTVSSVRRDSGCRIHVRKDADTDSQVIEFKGTKMQVDIALGILRQIVSSLDPQYQLIIPDAAQVTLEISPDLVGYVIGKAGSGVRMIRQRTACWVHVEELIEGASAQVVSISGPIGSVRDAYFLLKDALERVRPHAKDTDRDAAGDAKGAASDPHPDDGDGAPPAGSPRARARSPSDRRRHPAPDRSSSRHHQEPSKRPRRDAPPHRVSRKMGPMYTDGYPPRRGSDPYADDRYARPQYDAEDYYDPYAEAPPAYDPARPAASYGTRYDAMPGGHYPDVPDESRLPAALHAAPVAQIAAPAPIAQPTHVTYDSAYGVPMAAAAPQVQPIQVAAPMQQMATMAAPGQVLLAPQQAAGGQVMTIAGGGGGAPPPMLMLQPDGSYKAVQLVYQLPDGTAQLQQLQQQPQQQPQQQQPQQQQQQPQQQQQQPQQQLLSVAPQAQMYSFAQPTMGAVSAPMSASQILLDASQAGVLQQTLLATSQALQQQQQQQQQHQLAGHTMLLQPQQLQQHHQQQAGVVQLVMPGPDGK